MMERVKSFWYVLVTVLASVALLLAASCGGDSESEPSDGTGGTDSPSGTGGSGTNTSGTGGGSGTMTDASVDGAISSGGTVPENGTCTGTDMGSRMMPAQMTGVCQASGTNCPGGSPQSSDCADGLVCCIGEDQCDAVASTVMGTGFVESMSCVSEGTCPASAIVVATRPLEYPGCPAGQSCCITLPEGGFSLEGGLTGLLEGGLANLLEGGIPGLEGGVTRQDSGSSTSTTDAGTSTTVDAGEQTDASEQQ